jgi:pimeloyl-ACP methyl ester carboxylesterase
VLHARGVEQVILAGLSNGGLGASQLGPHLPIAGLILISGAEHDAPSAGVPTLVIHGKHDTMTDPEEARRYATRHGAKYVEVDAGHFAMLVRAEEVDREIHDFVAARVKAVALEVRE